MATKEDLALNKTQGEVHRIPCLKCTGKTDHTVLASVDMRGDEEDGNFSFSWTAAHQVVQCLGCKTVSFRKITSNSEDFVHNDDGETEYTESEELYPSRTEGRRNISDEAYYLPWKVRQIYDETLLALTNRGQSWLA